MDNKHAFQTNIFKEQSLPTADFSKLKLDPLKYEETLFKQMANDVKAPLEQQLASVQSIADSARKQADASQLQAKLAKEAAVKAEADAIAAKHEALIAKVLAVIAIIAPIIYDFVSNNWNTILKLFLK